MFAFKRKYPINNMNEICNLKINRKKQLTSDSKNEVPRRKRRGSNMSFRACPESISLFYWIPDRAREDGTPQAAGYYTQSCAIKFQ